MNAVRAFNQRIIIIFVGPDDLAGRVAGLTVMRANAFAFQDFDKLSAADKTAFLDAAKEGAKANRARVDEDDAKGVAELRSKGMSVVENVDKAKFQAALTPVYAQFEAQFAITHEAVNGEWADGMTTRQIARNVGFILPGDQELDAVEELGNAWETAYNDQWRVQG